MLEVLETYTQPSAPAFPAGEFFRVRPRFIRYNVHFLIGKLVLINPPLSIPDRSRLYVWNALVGEVILAVRLRIEPV